MKLLIRCFVFMLCILSLNVYASSCTSIIDAESGRLLYGENENNEYLIASTTKIMTALVTLNNTDVNKKIKIGDEVIDAYGSAIYIKPGEILTIKDLLYGLLLRSGNDASLALAKTVGGSTLGMAKLMNETALNIGMKNTKFFNPHGLDEESQNISSCYDMSILLKEAMNNSYFKKITNSKEYTLKTNFNTYKWNNKNKLLKIYRYANGGKIGYTKRAGHTFVSSAKKDNKKLIIATFNDNDMYNNHKKLYEKYFKLYDNYKLIDKNKLNIYFDKNYNLYTLSSFNMLLKKSELKNIKREVKIYKNINYNSSRTVVGKITIKLNNKNICQKTIYAERKPNKNSFIKKFKNILN